MKPCPFCGVSEIDVDYVGETDMPFYAATCDKCGASGPPVSSKEVNYDDGEGEAAALRLWEQRA